MKKLLFGLLGLFVCNFAQASARGTLFISTPDTQAILLINEMNENGELSKFYDQMNVEENINSGVKQKSIQLSNDRFSFVCGRVINIQSIATTSCTFVITPGVNTTDISTSISKINGKKLATLTMTQNFAKELAGVFPSDENGFISYLLNLENGPRLEVNGSASGDTTIQFSAE